MDANFLKFFFEARTAKRYNITNIGIIAKKYKISILSKRISTFIMLMILQLLSSIIYPGKAGKPLLKEKENILHVFY